MILWGPPGVGKTTLARLTAYAFDCEFIALSAVLSGVKDIRAAEERRALVSGRASNHPVHRRDPPLQQVAAGRLAALRGVGTLIIIGATHGKPSFGTQQRVASGRAPTCSKVSTKRPCASWCIAR